MQTINLNRTGDRPLQFTGELLAETDTRQHQGAGQNRWWELTLYREESLHKYVLAIGYRTQWQGEHNSDTVYVASTAAVIADDARAHPYLDGCSGFPSGMEEKQARLENDLRRCWEAGLTEILSALPPEEI